MTEIGKALSQTKIQDTQENVAKIKEIENELAEEFDKVKNAGLRREDQERGQLTVWQRLQYLVDPGTWHPLHSIYNPKDNEEGTTNVVDGLGRINGKWAVIVGFDNKVMAGAWIAGQSGKRSAGHRPGKASSYSSRVAGELLRGEAHRTGGSLS